MDGENLQTTSRASPLRNILKLRPIGPIQSSVLDGFGDVLGLKCRNTLEIRDRASEFQDAIVGPR
jgi:hypothetical protein